MTLPTYIINLDAQPHRRERILARLRPMAALRPEVVAAVYGRAIPEPEKRALIHPHYPRFSRSITMADGELGCALSHRKCYEVLLEGTAEAHGEAAPVALILEDDVLLAEDFEGGTLEAARFLQRQNGPAAILLSARTLSRRTPVPAATPGGNVVGRRHVSVHETYSAVGAYAYLINREGAQFMLDLGNPIPLKFVADDWYSFRRRGLRLWACQPHLASYAEDRSDSTVHADRNHNWERYRQYVQAHGTWRERHAPRWTPRRINLKLHKLLHGAVAFHKTWPQDFDHPLPVG